MKKLTGIRMTLPEGRLPGYYAQIVKGIASASESVDRDKELLFAGDDEVSAILAVLDKYAVAYETGPWLWLSGPDWARTRIWSDYVAETRSGNAYLDLSLASVVNLSALGPESELPQAGIQLEEHAIAFRLAEHGACIAAVDRKLVPLAEGIASSYRCSLSVVF